jgi:hypothetical protein
VSLFFAVMGWGEGGWSGAAVYLLLLIVCLTQSFYPTLLGWMLLFGPCVAYAIAVAATPRNGPWDEYVIFFLGGAVPAGALYFVRPWAEHSPDGNNPK